MRSFREGQRLLRQGEKKERITKMKQLLAIEPRLASKLKGSPWWKERKALSIGSCALTHLSRLNFNQVGL